MSPTKAVKTCYGKYFTFSGRASRSEFWWFYAFVVVVLIVLVMVPIFLFDENDEMRVIALIPAGLFFLASIFPQLSATIRRLHDANFSGWFYLFAFVPGIGGIVLLVFMVLPSAKGPNKWGNPEGHEVEVFA